MLGALASRLAALVRWRRYSVRLSAETVAPCARLRPPEFSAVRAYNDPPLQGRRAYQALEGNHGRVSECGPATMLPRASAPPSECATACSHSEFWTPLI